MLAAEPPNVEGARETARRTLRDGNRGREAVQASAEQSKPPREKRWDAMGILALPSVASLSGT
jgi:hypothetical protein